MYPANIDPVLLIAALLPSSTMLLVAMLLALLLIGLVTEEDKIQPFGYLVSLVAAIVFAIILVITIFPTLPFAEYLYNPNFQALAIVVLVMFLVVWFVTKEKSSTKLHKTVGLWFKPPTPR